MPHLGTPAAPGLTRRMLLSSLAAAPLARRAGAAAADDYRIYTQPPRLFLNPRRLRLLRRERERDSMRWRQFDALLAGGVRMPEEGFAWALHYQASQNPASGKRAVDWALNDPHAGLRQLALVYDWCQELLDSRQRTVLAGRLRRELAAAPPAGISATRSRVLAAAALAGDAPGDAAAELRRVIEDWWEKRIAPGLKSGAQPIPRTETLALFELLHAVRDNTQIELRDGARRYFASLPFYHLLSYYPATYPAAENDYRIPAFTGAGQPDLERAALSRAAELAMVAYDTNAEENQFLQGWLIHDRFLLRGPFGIPYEYLWANPYQPGLSYTHVPLLHHEPAAGRLFIRSSWDEDAVWFGLFDGEMQVFEQGAITVLDPRRPREALAIGDVTLLFGERGMKFNQGREPSGKFFILGLKPGAVYNVEVDDEELRQERADSGGTLPLSFPPGGTAGVRLYPPRWP